MNDDSKGSVEQGTWIQRALKRYQAPLVRYASRLLDDDERGRDVVQDVFLKLCRQDPARLDGHLAEWLFSVCRNRSLDILRKEKRMSPTPQTRLDARPTRDPGPLRILEVKDSLSRVSRILSTLKPNQQEVVRLKFQTNLSYREISRVTGLSESNVGFILHTALKIVRRELALQEVPGLKPIRRAK